MVTTWSTITLETAKRAVKIYNEGLYGCLKNPDLDKQAREMFADGLGSTSPKIGRQVEFIGRDYGGAAGFKAAYALGPDITRDIVANREQYEKAALSASPLLAQIPTRDTIEILYRPFVKPLHGKSNWQVWATKFALPGLSLSVHKRRCDPTPRRINGLVDSRVEQKLPFSCPPGFTRRGFFLLWISLNIEQHRQLDAPMPKLRLGAL